MKRVLTKQLNELDVYKLSCVKPTEGKKLAFKGFTNALTCRGLQYVIGNSYKHDFGEVAVSVGGFHSCIKPLDVFLFYPPSMARYCIVETSGDTANCDSGREQASSEINLKQELSLSQFITIGINEIVEEISPSRIKSKANNYSAISLIHDYSASINLGHCSISANAGDYSVATNNGNRCASTISGDQSVAINFGSYTVSSNTGNRSVSKTCGNYSVSASTGHNSVATALNDFSISTNIGENSFSTCYGNYSVAVSSGDNSASSVEGEHSIALVSGLKSKAKAKRGSAITIAHRNKDNELIHIRSGIAGKDIKEDVWYTLDENGEFIEQI